MVTEVAVRVRVKTDVAVWSHVVANRAWREPFAVLEIGDVEIVMYRDAFDRVAASLAAAGDELERSLAEWSATESVRVTS